MGAVPALGLESAVQGGHIQPRPPLSAGLFSSASFCPLLSGRWLAWGTCVCACSECHTTLSKSANLITIKAVADALLKFWVVFLSCKQENGVFGGGYFGVKLCLLHVC